MRKKESEKLERRIINFSEKRDLFFPKSLLQKHSHLFGQLFFKKTST